MGSWDRKQQKHQRAPQLLLSCLHDEPAVVSTGAGLSTTVWQPQIQGPVREYCQEREGQQPASCPHGEQADQRGQSVQSTRQQQQEIQGQVRGCCQGSEAQQPGQQPGQPERGRRCCRAC